MSEWNARIIEEFRANAGVVGGPFEGATLLILHTKGSKSGIMRETPLMFRDEEGRRFIFASKGGAPSHPDWYRNLLADPRVTVEAPGETYVADAAVLAEPERSAVFERQAADRPPFGEYQRKTDRVIPVVELVRID